MAELNKNDIQNNKEEVPFAHYEALFRALDPDEAALRCGVPFENGGCWNGWAWRGKRIFVKTCISGRTNRVFPSGRTPMCMRC